MPRIAIRPSQDLARMLRERRAELKLTLRQAEERTRTFGKVIPFTTLSKVEQGRVDPGVVRFQQLLEIYDLPQQAALDAVAVETMRGPLPKSADPETLYESAVRLRKEGDNAQALAHLYAVKDLLSRDPRRAELRQKAQFQFALVVAGLGRHQLSKHLVEELLAQRPPAPMALRCLIQLGSCWERLGVLELALAALGRAEIHAAAAGPHERACVTQERGLIELSLGNREESQRLLEQARRLFKEAGDEQGAAKTSFSMVRVLLSGGQAKAAIRAAHQLVQGMGTKATQRLRPEAAVLLGLAHLAAREFDNALIALRTALAEAVSMDSTTARFLAHHYLAQAYGETGDKERAQAEQAAADQFRKYIDFVPDPVVFEGGGPRAGTVHKQVGVRKHRHRPGK
jgi:tetratricopeptide (TPR) repeat protein